MRESSTYFFVRRLPLLLLPLDLEPLELELRPDETELRPDEEELLPTEDEELRPVEKLLLPELDEELLRTRRLEELDLLRVTGFLTEEDERLPFRIRVLVELFSVLSLVLLEDDFLTLFSPVDRSTDPDALAILVLSEVSFRTLRSVPSSVPETLDALTPPDLAGADTIVSSASRR